MKEKPGKGGKSARGKRAAKDYLPSKDEILAFIGDNEGGRRDIARASGIKGEACAALKRL
jgi:hypothetical protein